MNRLNPNSKLPVPVEVEVLVPVPPLLLLLLLLFVLLLVFVLLTAVLLTVMLMVMPIMPMNVIITLPNNIGMAKNEKSPFEETQSIKNFNSLLYDGASANLCCCACISRGSPRDRNPDPVWKNDYCS